jgi:hypothetical protein
MPNIVSNAMILSGPRAALAAFKAEFLTLRDDGLVFDFDRILPTPDHTAAAKQNPAQDDSLTAWRAENWGALSSGFAARWTEITKACAELSFATLERAPHGILAALARRQEVSGLTIHIASRCFDNLDASNARIADGEVEIKTHRLTRRAA